ncbi:MAG: chemotaxis-specific protein-glutamate methyltransferase CheB [Desulfobacteraceae bacterium]|nr:chemotaxis-specific protein-glutamate methyltransferase CheB [Desulfobacteraceae bacterium]
MMKILIVDDSALIRSILKHLLNNKIEKNFIIAGEASDGERAVEMNRELKPDVIIMDINMPKMNGIEATRRIMKDNPVPILIFSREIDADISYKAMSAGAVDVMPKPTMDQINEPNFYKKFLQKIQVLGTSEELPVPGSAVTNSKSVLKKNKYQMLVMGASAGGPVAVKEVLENLPGTFPFGIALVQHMERGFDKGYVRWLNQATRLSVRLAGDTELIRPGEVFVAPVDKHLIVAGNRLMLDDGPRILNQKPCADVLFESAALSYGDRLVGVLLTGMGRDGASGCVSVLSKGGITLVQDEQTSAIFGMPKAAIEMGGASKILPLQKIAEYLIWLARGNYRQ